MRRTLVIAILLAFGSAGAQALTYDPDQLPKFQGKIEAYKLTPGDELDGFFLDDGLEIHVSAALSSELARTVQPGDTVTIHGLRSQDGQMVQAFSVANDVTGLKVVDTVAPAHQNPSYHPQPMRFIEVRGRIKRLLHNVEGDFIGVLLDDGTNIRVNGNQGQALPHRNCLTPGREISASGTGGSGTLGQAIETRSTSLVKAVADNAGPQQCIIYPAPSPANAGCPC